MVWVLIIGAIVGGGKATSITTAEFATEEACVRAAKQTATSMWEMESTWARRGVFWSCSPKG